MKTQAIAFLISTILGSTVYTGALSAEEDYKTYTLGEILVLAERAGVKSIAINQEITAENIEATNSRTVAEALQYIPGVQVTMGRKSEASISIHGFSQDKALILIDGVPYYETKYGKFDMNQLSIENVARIDVIKGVSPCAAGGYSVEAVLRTPQAVGLKQVAELLKTVGDVRLVEEFGVATAETKNASAKVFAGGQIVVVGGTPKDASEYFDDVARAVLRANMCSKCGICERTCPTGAIKLAETLAVDEKLCNQCGKCAASCVVAHYFDKLATEISPREQKRKPKR